MNVVESAALRRLLGPDKDWIIHFRDRKQKELVYTECTFLGCPYRSGSRSDVNVALRDMMTHVRSAHDAPMRKHERDVERKMERDAKKARERNRNAR